MVELNENVEVKDLNTQEEGLSTAFNLDNENELNTLNESLEVQSMFFNPEKDKPYKINLTSPNMQLVTKEFENDKVIKYAIAVKYKSASGEEGEGVWEVGKTVARAIVEAAKGAKDTICDVNFSIIKTGVGKDTRYNITRDF